MDGPRWKCCHSRFELANATRRLTSAEWPKLLLPNSRDLIERLRRRRRLGFVGVANAIAALASADNTGEYLWITPRQS